MIVRAFAASLCALLLAATAPAQQAELPGLVILPGETWIFRIENGQPAGARRVEADAKPAKGELMVALEGEGTSMLVVTNNSGDAYNYRAFITVKANHKGNRISVCTLQPGIQTFESWTDPLPAIRIADFTEAPKGQMQCS